MHSKSYNQKRKVQPMDSAVLHIQVQKMWNDQAITINEDSTLSVFKLFVNDLDIKLDPNYNSYI